MDKDQKELRKFLEQQLQWSKEQARILDDIDQKLHEMKRIAKHAVEHELSECEVNKLNTRLNDLKNEVHTLERLLKNIVH